MGPGSSSSAAFIFLPGRRKKETPGFTGWGVGRSRRECAVLVYLSRATWRYAPYEAFARFRYQDRINSGCGCWCAPSVSLAIHKRIRDILLKPVSKGGRKSKRKRKTRIHKLCPLGIEPRLPVPQTGVLAVIRWALVVMELPAGIRPATKLDLGPDHR